MRLLGFGVLAAVFAVITNQVVEAALAAAPSFAPEPRAREQPAQAQLDGARLARTLGAAALRPRTIAAPRRAAPLKLLGTLDGHAASLVDDAGRCRTLRVGDTWDDVELLEVAHGRITIRRGDALEQWSTGARPPPPAAGRIPVSLHPQGATISISRAELERRLPELIQLAMTGARVVPAFANSKMVGVRIAGVQPGSLYEELGLRNGDVLETLNGAPLGSPQLTFGLLQQLKDQRAVAAVVNRSGERLTWQLICH